AAMTAQPVLTTRYEGDRALDEQLRRAGSRMNAAEVRALLAGVLAAPAPPADPEAWTALVAEQAGPALKAQLVALKHELESRHDDGLAAPWTRARIDALRAELKRRGLDGLIVPRGDEHQGEYVPSRAERLAWITGFTGSAGAAIVLLDKAALFVDGRYTLQARQQVDTAVFETRHLVDEPPHDWLAAHTRKGMRIGFDPWLHTPDGIAKLGAAALRDGAELVAVDGNPIDAVWTNQPPEPIAPVRPHEERYAGRSAAEKRAELGAKLKADGYAAAVITAPDSLAWLLNIRGGDVPHTPLPLGFAILHADGLVDLFIEPRKLLPSVMPHLGNQVKVEPRSAFGPALDRLGQQKARVLVDAATGAVWMNERLKAAGAEVVRGQDPCALSKACKNEVELQNTRNAHVRDGVAVTRFLAWLAKEAPTGRLTELSAAARLFEFRTTGEGFRDTSFTTISGAGANGAIVHYRVTDATNARIAPDMLYLVDSGAQYLDGTTDVTRTVAIGTPTPEQRDRFTRVLKGHIALATARFPKGTSGSQLDALARMALWQVGLDYDHGTGHGVGSYLSVHEGPHRISKVPNTVALQPGMIVSNEPGYYKTGAYGIRIENLVAVCEVDTPPGAERPLLGFETLTLVPIDRTLVDTALMAQAEIQWLDAYHARVRQTLMPLVDGAVALWLDEATRPLGS
ncbi:MAG TPA: aminopeptidase P family protein, partial [Alphaproteobacteria bacterium]|nr:aminopeptidase P family protein [Alphaproteobacteria bacterium]